MEKFIEPSDRRLPFDQPAHFPSSTVPLQSFSGFSSGVPGDKAATSSDFTYTSSIDQPPSADPSRTEPSSFLTASSMMMGASQLAR
uniref:Ovule protein n=1 Tax=Mesocestoides corti TaxID=53468 RepID=A0A5K3F0R3_MESCO